MNDISELIKVMVSSIVDSPDKVSVEEESAESGVLYQVKVAKDDVGKVIGKKGRIATAIRTVAKAAGAKQSKRIMVNIFNKPLEE
mgnify:CR=1 FL=1|tara:strand:- start:3127 stop:3381 length:255 start_codon:yes stop_codon:yes gene_type:complete